MAKQVMKKYFIFQEEGEILIVINAAPDEFDAEAIGTFWDEVQARGLKDAIDCNIEKVFDEAERGEVIRIGGYKSSDTETEGDGESTTITTEGDTSSAQPFEIEIANGNLSATLVVKKGVAQITEEQIRQYLQGLNIVYGVIEENINTLAKKFPYTNRIKIAQGTPKTNGNDAEIELVKDIKTDLTPETVVDGRADFKKLNLISPVQPGDAIQIRTPPAKGKPGSDIFGNEIPGRDGRDKRLIKGKNTKVSEDGRSLVATEEGFLYLGPGHTVNVRAVYTVQGDVDYHTGIIEYKGDVIVKGDIRSGFNVHAGGDIQIHGSVEDSVIEAEGEIILNGGVRSSGQAVLRAGGDVKVNFVENTRIETPGNVYINRESINCEINAGGDVEVLWSKGRIIGGHMTAGGMIIAPTLGSEMGGLVELAIEPEGWESHFKKLDRINDHLTETYGDKKLGVEERKNTVNRLVGERVSESDVLNDFFAYSLISAKHFLSPVNVRFGNIVQRIKYDVGPTTFTYKDLEIRQESRMVDKGKCDELRKKRQERKAAKETENP